MPLAQLLDRLIELLEAHRSPRLDWLRETAALLDRDPEAFWARLNSAAFWGGAHSIANEALADNPGLDPVLWQMQIREFRELMLELAEIQRSRGDSYPDIEFWIAAYDNWNQAGN